MEKSEQTLSSSGEIEDCNKQTESNIEDDTEDYIQPSQPMSFQSSESGKSMAGNELDEMGASTIDETMHFPITLLSTPFGNSSKDFIPETETHVKRKLETSEITSQVIYQKRLNLDDTLERKTLDMFSTQSQKNEPVDGAQIKVPESPSILDIENTSSVPESPMQINETFESENSNSGSSSKKIKHCLEETVQDESINEVSGELPEQKIVKSDNCESSVFAIPEEHKIHNSSYEECEGKTGADSLMRFSEVSLMHEVNAAEILNNKKTETQDLHLDDTVDVDDIVLPEKYSVQKCEIDAVSAVQPPTDSLSSQTQLDSQSTPLLDENAVEDRFRMRGVLKNISDENLKMLQKHSTPENPLSESLKINESTSTIENGTPENDMPKPYEINFTLRLLVNCQAVVDPLTNKILSKKIVNVQEFVKNQPKQTLLHVKSDSPYKTKTFSSSSSGSVYSDKAGLPYVLPGRISAGTENSSASSVDIDKHFKIAQREAWINEYMIPMTLDELMPRYFEHLKTGELRNSSTKATKRKTSLRIRKKSHWNHGLDNVLESSMTEQSSGNNSFVPLPSFQNSEKSKPSQSPSGDESKLTKTDIPCEEENKNIQLEENVEKKLSPLATSEKESRSLNSDITEGTLIFARWTDKRYYPGKILAKAKYDRWEVVFDDGTLKVIREDLILPLHSLTKGELVFALVSDKYMSGKIADIIRTEKDIKFKIELDDTNEVLIVKKSDICLNEVMVGIIREKFNPGNKPNVTIKSSDIDFDNVVTGKRIREQRTPIRGTTLQQPGSSTASKRRVLRSGEKASAEKRTPLPKQDLVPEKPSKKKGSVLEQLNENFDSEEIMMTEVKSDRSTTKRTPKTDVKPSGSKKRGRALRYDSEKPGSSSKKSKQSNDKSDSDSVSLSRALINEFDNETDNVVKQSDEKKKSIKDQKLKGADKSAKTLRSKETKSQAKFTTLRNKKLVASNQDGKKKRKKTS